MARIAYKEWKERKQEEDRQIRKQERMDRRDRLMGNNAHNYHRGNPEAIVHLRRQNAAAPNSDNGEGVMLAYGLNKNLKKLRDTRPKSAKPLRKKKVQQQ